MTSRHTLRSETDKLYSLPEAAEILGIPQQTIRNRHHSRGVGRKVGTVIVFTRADLDLLSDWPYRRGRQS